MKFTIIKAFNRIELIKFFRSQISNLAMQEAVYYVDNLPYSFTDLSKDAVLELEEFTKNFALSVAEPEIQDTEYDYWNVNINPPEEYIVATAWYNSLSEEEKGHVDQIVLWKNKPAVC